MYFHLCVILHYNCHCFQHFYSFRVSLSLSPLSLLRAREQGQVGEEVREEVLINHLNEVPSALKGDMVEDFHTYSEVRL